MEAVWRYTTHVIPFLKPVNFNYYPLVKNVLEEGLLEHELIALKNHNVFCNKATHR